MANRLKRDNCFSDPQKASDQGVGARAVGRHLPRQERPRHHPGGLRQLQA